MAMISGCEMEGKKRGKEEINKKRGMGWKERREVKGRKAEYT